MDSVEDCQRIQWNTDFLQIWVLYWQVEFNASNCKVLYF